jgi:hypothetical protein
LFTGNLIQSLPILYLNLISLLIIIQVSIKDQGELNNGKTNKKWYDQIRRLYGI